MPINNQPSAVKLEDCERDCEARFRTSFDRAAVGIAHVTADGHWLHVNKRLCDFLGYSRSELTKLTFADVTHADDLESDLALARRLVAGDVNSYSIEKRYIRKSKEAVWALVTCSSVGTLKDGTGYVIAVIEDITQRRQAEASLRENEERLRMAAEAASFGTYDIDIASCRVHWSAEMKRILGLPENFHPVIVPGELPSFVHPEDAAALKLAMLESFRPEGDGLLNLEHRIVLPSGDIRWISLKGKTYFAGEGAAKTPERAIGILMDVTERKQAEADLRESEERLQELNAALESRVERRTRALRQSEQRYREIADLAEQRAHQLRGLTRELARTEERERRRLASVLHDHIQQLLIGARMRIDLVGSKTPDDEIQEQLVGIATILEMAIDAARSLAVELVPPVLHSQGLPAALQWLAVRMLDQCQLKCKVDADHGSNPAQEELRDLLFQTARELLLNIVKHAHAHEAEITLRRVDQQLWLTVVDHGVGFDAPHALATSNSFGIFHLRERMAAIGGNLNIHSVVGQGTRVDISVPLDYVPT